MNILDPLETSRRIASSYRRYLLSSFSPRRADLQREMERALDNDFRLSKGPFLQASAPFVTGASVSDLVAEGVLSKGFRRLTPASFPIERPLYVHQEQAIRRSVSGRNLVVATGTGSGKTEGFLIPIVDHLLREAESGALGEPGVRALLLYPMNALANDQVKRLRTLLADLPEITFGRYVGETPPESARAEEAFVARFPGEPRLPNELLSRERMQEAPPHILLTNYAMLEYLLLRPADSALFDGAKGGHWQFLVLDEAHVYNGAQGTEVAMLLRRVRDRVVRCERGRLRCFATSATLGRGEQDYPQLVRFATDLFDENFEWESADIDRRDVVGAVRKPLVQGEATHELDQERYGEIQRAFRAGAPPAELATIAGSGLAVASGEDAHAYLARLLRHDKRVVTLQQALQGGSVELRDVASLVFSGPDAERDLVSLIDLCVAARARGDDSPLVPARYHFFLRSLEGAYLCQHPAHPAGEPRLRLARHKRCPSCARTGREAAMFELGVCRTCRAEYLVGHVGDDGNGDVLSLATDFGARQFVLLGPPVDADDEDEEAASGDPVATAEERVLCPGCGRLGEKSLTCECTDRPAPLQVWLVKPPKDGGVLHTCAACASRMGGEAVLRVLTGSDAPVAVVATDLYQALPKSADAASADRVGEGRKLLAFSDSRQDAAFFAPYLENTYNRAVRRRLLAQAITRLNERGAPRTDDLIVETRRLAEDALLLDPDAGRLSNETEVGSWLTEELLAVDRRQGLEGTGTADIVLAVPRRWEPPRALLDLGLDDREVLDLVQLLLESVRAGGAITTPDGVDIRHERFAPRNRDLGLRLQGPEPGKGVLAWLPAAGHNRRLELLDKVFTRKGIELDSRALLKDIWDRHFADRNGPWADVLVSSSDARRGPLWRLSWQRFEFTPASEDHRPLRCGTCQRVWWRTVAGVCPAWRCPGTVGPIGDLSLLTLNHYATLYRDLKPIGISVEEHTAQLSSDRASSVQDQFVGGRINVLSCSTTFELGVDVGEVQAVLLRNVPPSPANYVQRAGRAGRRTDSAALVVTFAQRRSHDLSHFDTPRAMVDGAIAPPVILLDNPAIVRRHVHSVAFAAFERRCVEDGTGAHRTVEDFFSAVEPGEPPADARFVAWLRDSPLDLSEALARLLPPETAEALGVADWAWVDALVEPTDEEPTFGWLARAGDEARGELELVEELIRDAVAADQLGRGAHLQGLQRTLARRQLLSFLASRNVLPKYGFPVDVVGLNLAASGDRDAANLDLNRDLSLAVSEYAPEALVVAAKTLWRSTGLGTRPGHGWPTYKWAVCGDCRAFRQQLETLPACGVCGSSRLAQGQSGTFAIPLFGFVGKRHAKPGESRPPRDSLTERYFSSYRDIVPDLHPVTGLGGQVLVEARTSRQGRISVINRGPRGRGYRLCEWCGFGQIAPASGKEGKGPAAHPDIRRPGRECKGSLRWRQLGHEFLTDVTEVRLGLSMSAEAARSTLYALLEGVGELAIARGDVDGTLSTFHLDRSPALILFDNVPGGAGHARRIVDHLPELFRAALARVASCECGPETSCYNCLRGYTNQAFHETLARGPAADVLQQVLGTTLGRSRYAGLDLLSEDIRPLVRQVIEAGAHVPVAGWEPDTLDGWIVEAAWPEMKLAIVVDSQPRRDSWLAREGWTVRSVEAWTVQDLVRALGIA